MTKKFAASAVAGALLSFVSAPAVFGEGLTKEGRDRAIKYLEQTGREFVAAVSTISDAQWSFKPSSDRWSIAECAEHIAVTEEFI